MRPLNSSKTLSAVVIGCGRIGGGTEGSWTHEADFTHGAAYAGHPGFQIAACIDTDAQRRENFRDNWKAGAGFESLDECIAAGIAFDVASVCVPTGEHARVLDALLNTPVRAVLCEKPLTGDARESRKLANAYREKDRLLAVNYTKRHFPEVQALERELKSGAWGRVRAATGFYTKGVRNNGSHLLNLLQQLLGPMQAETVTHVRPGADEGDPTVDATLRTADGIPVHITGGDHTDYVLFELTVVAEEGVATIERSGQTIRRRRRVDHPAAAGYRALDRGDWEEEETPGGLAPVVENLYAAVTTGAPLVCDAESAIATDELCDELLRHAKG